MAKAHRLPFVHSDSVSVAPFDVVHSDVWGPFPEMSCSSFRYYVLSVDDNYKVYLALSS